MHTHPYRQTGRQAGRQTDIHIYSVYNVYFSSQPQYINIIIICYQQTQVLFGKPWGQATVHLPGEILVGHGTQAIDCCQDLYFVEDFVGCLI